MFFWILIALQIIMLFSGSIILFRLFYITITFGQNKWVPYVATPRKAIKKMLTSSKILSDSRKTIKIIDMGSGSGKMIFYLARRVPANVLMFGVERSWLLFVISKIRYLISPNQKQVQIKHDNWDNTDLSKFNYLFLFLTTQALKDLLPRFKNELAQGTKIITCLFSLPDSNAFSKKKIVLSKNYSVFVHKKL